MTSVSELVGGGLNGLALDLVGPTSVVTNAGDGVGDVNVLSPAESLAVVQSLDSSELIEVGLHEIRELVQEGATLGTGCVQTPDGVKGLLSGDDGDIDILLRGLGDLGDQLAVGGIDDTSGPPSSIYG